MIDFLHLFKFDLRKEADECFTMIVDGEVVTNIPTLHAGETSRGIRISVVNFKYDEKMSCYAYFKSKQDNELIRVKPFSRTKNLFDIYYPRLPVGEYECEIILCYDGKTISSGIFTGVCEETLANEFATDVEISTTVQDIINTYDTYSELYKKRLIEVGTLSEKSTSIINNLNDKEKQLEELIENIPSVETDKGFIFVQKKTTPIWEVTHNLGKYPSVVITDNGGNTVYGDISYISENKLIISFSIGFSGKAYLN
ncbi:hypothetical protein [Peptostreptococcus faecalis]|uniref:hypothetical protein n=1 Tax=Peptostreptococcus faecalis TaxID=2045015 RepID=UPI000C799016|nr:hypothetical protein [Peptostreptococcus faecalis]